MFRGRGAASSSGARGESDGGCVRGAFVSQQTCFSEGLTMFRSLAGDAHGPEAGRGPRPGGPGRQESSWISALSRPPLALLPKAGRGRPAAGPGDGWLGPVGSSGLLGPQAGLVRQLDASGPGPRASGPGPRASGPGPHASGPGPPASGPGPRASGPGPRASGPGPRASGPGPRASGPGPHVSNLTQLQCVLDASLLQGAEGPEVCRGHRGQWAPGWAFFSRVWAAPPELSLVTLRAPGGGPHRWNSFWGDGGPSAICLLSDVSHIEDRNLTGPHLTGPHLTGPHLTGPHLTGPHLTGPHLTGPHHVTKAAAVFMQSRWILGESAGPISYKRETFNTGALQTVQNVEGPGAPQQRSAGQGATTPDMDNGYYSLEEASCLQMLTESLLSAPEAGSAGQGRSILEDASEEAGPSIREEDENVRRAEAAPAKRDSLTPPKCQNKAIAFIMGCPCSDDEGDDSRSSESSDEDDDDDDDDDDGFDSEGSSSLSDSSDDDEDSDVDGEHLWSALCHSVDPYNPRNFRAQLQTRTPPQTAPAPPSPPDFSPLSSPSLPSLPRSQSPSDSWDDSGSDADEAESLRLWTSFSTCSDPYSPLNFQASLRTQDPGPAGTGSRTREAPQAERVDTGFREVRPRRTTKKVRFCDHVDEVFIGAEEDRRGPWEEFARDRCRFLRRCQEVEQNIGYCLQPQHRSEVYHRLTRTT